MDTTGKPTTPVSNAAFVFLGAAVGGAVGFFLFGWLVGQGFYAPAIPGVMLGLGGGLLAKERSLPVALVCGGAALLLCVFAEWRHFPFTHDSSLGYFLTHLGNLRQLTLTMFLIGGGAGFWFAWRGRMARSPETPPQP